MVVSGAGGSGGGAGEDPIKSAGCGKPLGSLTTGAHEITSSDTDREYTIDIPDDYDPDKPYRLIFAWHWINASDEAVVNGQVSNGGEVWAYYGFKNQAKIHNEPAIFIAPQSRNGTWDQQDASCSTISWSSQQVSSASTPRGCSPRASASERCNVLALDQSPAAAARGLGALPRKLQHSSPPPTRTSPSLT